jgi:hypothetical protein
MRPSPFSDAIRRESERPSAEVGLKSPFRKVSTPASDSISQDLKLKIHRRLIDTIDLTRISTLESVREV